MADPDLVLNRIQRDEIMKAIKAIERQARQTLGKTEWQALFVIGTNLAIIQAHLSNLPRASSN